MNFFHSMRPSNGFRLSHSGRSDENLPQRDESPERSPGRSPGHRTRRIERWVASRVGLTRAVPGSMKPTGRGEEYRPPPPRPVPLEFPHWVPAGHTRPFTGASADQMHKLFTSLHGVAGIKEEHLDALNITCREDVRLEDLVPEAAVLPPEGWDAADDMTTYPDFTLSNGRQAPGLDVFRDRAKDIMLDNDVAFAAAQRVPPPRGKSAVKLGSFFRFWLALDFVGQYWDSSEDRYFMEDVPEQDGGNSPAGVNGSRKRKRERYEGRRIGAGPDMPDLYREDAVRDFVDPITWLFGCQIIQPRLQPRFAMRRTLFPVRVTNTVLRTPTDRQRARGGFADGPVVAIQCRPETKFHAPGETGGVGAEERLNLLREVAAAMLIAQERGREGKTMSRPGEGQWYTTVPRWGGGPGGEVGDAAGDTDERAPKKEEKRGSSRNRSRRDLNAEAYQKVAPGLSLWDSRITYMHIGKPPSSDIDHIYLISSLNHHVSLVDFRVHAAYLEVLESGTVPSGTIPASDGAPWFELKVHRTRWYDLFRKEDRLELLRGLWAIMAYMMRGDET